MKLKTEGKGMDNNLDSRALNAYQQYKAARQENMIDAAYQAGRIFLAVVAEIERQDAEVRANPEAFTVRDLGEHVSKISMEELRLAELREQKEEVRSYLDSKDDVASSEIKDA